MTWTLLKAIVDKPFATISYKEAIDLLQKSGRNFEFPVDWGTDLQSEHERYLTEVEFSDVPLFVTDYPKEFKVSTCKFPLIHRPVLDPQLIAMKMRGNVCLIARQ